MNIIKQTSAGLSTANVYADLIDLESYSDMRGIDISTYSDTKKEQSLFLAANDWIDAEHDLRGGPINSTQSTKLPTTEIPLPNRDFVDINCMIAIQNLKGLLIVALTKDSANGQLLSKETGLDVLKKKVTYAEGTSVEAGSFNSTIQADSRIEKYLSTSAIAGIMNVRW